MDHVVGRRRNHDVGDGDDTHGVRFVRHLGLGFGLVFDAAHGDVPDRSCHDTLFLLVLCVTKSRVKK